MVANAQVARALSEIADLLDVLGERFKPEAYRRAARSIEALPESLEAIAARGELRTIPGVGEAISEKVAEILRTGSLAYLDRLQAQVPGGVLELMHLPGVGPKTARRFWVELGVGGPQELAEAIAAGRLAGVKGFAERKIALLRAAVDGAGALAASARRPIEEVWPVARAIVDALKGVPSVHEVAVAGSLRRARETVGDLDVLVTAEEAERVFDAFSSLTEVKEVRMRGPTKETVVLGSGLQVDLRVVEPEAFGAALQYFTGSKDHNVRLRSLARDRGLKVNEYGVYREEERVAGRTEADVYAALGLAWIPPELREDHGEIASAAAGTLPRLVEGTDLVYEPHAHLPPAPTVGDLDRLSAAARARAVVSVGAVTAIVEGGVAVWTAPAGVRERLGRALAGVRLVPVVEVRGWLDAGVASAARELGAEHLVLAPTPGAEVSLPRDAPPVALIAHAPGTAETSRPVIDLALRLGAAVEVGPGRDRFDSTAGQRALGAGVPLSVPAGLDGPEGGPVAAVALGFARRAGATREQVVNARPPEPASVPPSPGARSPTRPARRRR